MAEARIKEIIQKRTSLKTLLTKFENALNAPDRNPRSIKLRLDRITQVLNDYENLHDEWSVLRPADQRLAEFENIQDQYYLFAAQADEIINPCTPIITPQTNSTPVPSVSFSTAPRRPKLPESQLPKFSGDYNRWLSFKNTFVAMIDSRDDISDVEKFLYLKSALKGEALSKISIFTTSAEDYKKAWSLLVSTYEIKKIIVVRHLKGILNLPPIERESYESITKLIDSAQQHVSSLQSLNINFGSEALAQIIDSKLPRHLAEKWDEEVKDDEVPQFDRLCKFLHGVAVRLSNRQKPRSEKRENSHDFRHSSKRVKSGDEPQVFMIQNVTDCFLCKGQNHALFRCPQFLKMSVKRRFEIVKNAKLCRNCMRSHPGACKLSNCTICNKKHNTLLHFPTNDSDQTKTKDLEKSNESK